MSEKDLHGRLTKLRDYMKKPKDAMTRKKEREKKVSLGLTPSETSRTQPSKETIEDIYDHFQKAHYDNTSDGTGVHHLEYKPPKWSKKKLPDYRPGPVKVYTKEEIAQYERERDNDT